MAAAKASRGPDGRRTDSRGDRPGRPPTAAVIVASMGFIGTDAVARTDRRPCSGPASLKRWTRQMSWASFARSGEAPGSDNGTLWDPRGAFGLERGGEGLADLGGGGADGQGDGPGDYRPPGRSAPRRPGLRTLRAGQDEPIGLVRAPAGGPLVGDGAIVEGFPGHGEDVSGAEPGVVVHGPSIDLWATKVARRRRSWPNGRGLGAQGPGARRGRTGPLEGVQGVCLRLGVREADRRRRSGHRGERAARPCPRLNGW